MEQKEKIAMKVFVFGEDPCLFALRRGLISPEQARVDARNGRQMAAFAEEMAAALYGFDRGDNNEADVDGSGATGTISVKCVTKTGMKLQASRNVGKGRTCTQEDLNRAIRANPWHVLMDITQAPETIKMAAVPGAWLERFAEKGELKPSGWKAPRLWSLLAEDFELIESHFSLLDASRGRALALRAALEANAVVHIPSERNWEQKELAKLLEKSKAAFGGGAPESSPEETGA